MRPGCNDARIRRILHREQQALLIGDLIIAVALIGFIAAVFVGCFQ